MASQRKPDKHAVVRPAPPPAMMAPHRPRRTPPVPPEVVESVRERVSVVDWIAEECEGRRFGQWWRFACCLHDGDGPNLAAHASDGRWTCFVCGQHGIGPIDFAMARFGLAFPDALRVCADRAGIMLPGADDGPALPANDFRPRKPLAAPRRARKPFRPQLHRNEPYSLPAFAAEQRIALALLQRWGVEETRVHEWEDRRTDRMVPAVSIPHRDTGGRLIRSQIRLLRDGERLKRWSADGKGRGAPLFGLDWLAKVPASWPVIVTEGATDCLAHAVHAREMECAAIGVPGVTQWTANPCRPQAIAAIGSRPLYVWCEPENDPQNDDPRKRRASLVLVEAVAADFPAARVILPESHGYPKDLSDLHRADPNAYVARLREGM